MRPETIRRDLAKRCPDAHPAILDCAAEMAFVMRRALGRSARWKDDPDCVIRFTKLADTLTHFLHELGTRRVADSRAEKICASALVASETLLAHISMAGHA